VTGTDPSSRKEGSGSRRGTAHAKAPWQPTTEALLEDWHFRATRAQVGHQLQAEKTRWFHLGLGVPVVIFTTMVGTGAFAAINDTTTNSWKIAAGVVSILAAVLASVQTFLAFGERSDRHRVAATRYAGTRRSIELALTNHDASAVPLIKGEMDRIGGASPQIGQRTWDAARALAEDEVGEWREGRGGREHESLHGTGATP
jgi:hypothetical protein